MLHQASAQFDINWFLVINYQCWTLISFTRTITSVLSPKNKNYFLWLFFELIWKMTCNKNRNKFFINSSFNFDQIIFNRFKFRTNNCHLCFYIICKQCSSFIDNGNPFENMSLQKMSSTQLTAEMHNTSKYRNFFSLKK